AQTDAANLTAKDIDWQNGLLVYRRKKLGPLSEPCRLTIGNKLRKLLNTLPSSGDLFPNIKRTQQTIGPQNSLAVVVSQELLALACIHIAMHGLNVRRSAVIRSDS